MLDGDINDFLDDMVYGYELLFVFRGKKYFLEGMSNEERKLTYYMWTIDPPADDYSLILVGDEHNYPLEEFLALKIWDGKTFMEAQEEMRWVDE
ncbi:MAG: hypothetical protein LUE27_08580 [Clostridia bacterium]|nr:hypothetical protein [Clostridia bacterium]